METMVLKELSRYPIGTWADIIYRNALLHSDRLAFAYGSQRVSFSQYNSRVNSLIHALGSMGLRKGDGIGVVSWNCLSFTDVYGAAMKGGFIMSPFNPRLVDDELDYLINYSQVKVLFVGLELVDIVNRIRPRLSEVRHYICLEGKTPDMREHQALLDNFPKKEPDVDLNEDDPYLILYTSGTTGTPRGAVYSHIQKLEEARTKALQIGVEPNRKHVMILPLFHIGGSSFFWTFFFGAASNVIMPNRSFDPVATLRSIQDEKATDLDTVPTQIVMMLSTHDIEKYDLTSLKTIKYGASPMPVELLRKAIERFGPIFEQGYGQTESGPDITYVPKEMNSVLEKSSEEQKVLASCGQPCIWVHARIVDEGNKDVEPHAVGEIIVQSKCIMKEYWNQPKYTREAIVDGWHHTGDMGYYDEKGFIYIIDRKRDMIVTGGENVYSKEVEEALNRHPAVLETAVIGIPDEKWIERVHAVVVLKKGQQANSEELINFCKQNLARYKAPRSVDLVSSLPKNPQGKILKREIRENYRQRKR
jgi:long-chain acyl-CoA synthetase